MRKVAVYGLIYITLRMVKGPARTLRYSLDLFPMLAQSSLHPAARFMSQIRTTKKVLDGDAMARIRKHTESDRRVKKRRAYGSEVSHGLHISRLSPSTGAATAQPVFQTDSAKAHGMQGYVWLSPASTVRLWP